MMTKNQPIAVSWLMNAAPRNPEMGVRAAREFGSEYYANPGSSRIEYLNSAAFYFREGVDSLSQLTEEERAICHREFEVGIKNEKELTRSR